MPAKFVASRVGESIHAAAARAIKEARRRQPTYFEFNGHRVHVTHASTVEEVVADYQSRCDEERAKYEATPEYKARRAEAEKRYRQQCRARAGALLMSPASMSLRDPEGWKACVDSNRDPYGAACMTYAERWARIMEGKIAAGAKLEDIAKDASHLADEEGITGFMYGCAVATLAKVWKYGEELRRWSNRDLQIKDEGDRANETGGVLNPALLTIRG